MRAKEYRKLLARNIKAEPGLRKDPDGRARVSDQPMSPRTLELVAERFRVLGEPVRLRILQALCGAERSVSELVELLDLQQANVSKHLQQLHRAGIVERRRAGLQVFYRVLDPGIFQLCDLVCGSLQAQLEASLKAVRQGGR
jgi:ArsR family transcriptional regulator